MPTTPVLALPYPSLSDSADVPRDIQALAVKIDGLSFGAALVSALPATPPTGTEVYYQSSGMATDGVVWHLRYRTASASAYKWEFLGGADLTAGNDASETGITGTTYLNLAPAVNLTVPLAGDYLITHGAYLYNPAAEIFLSAGIGAASTVDANAIAAGGAAAASSGSRSKRHNAIAAAALINLQKRVVSSTGQIQRPFLAVRPIRVG